MKAKKDKIEVRGFLRGFQDLTVIINDQLEIECIAEFEYYKTDYAEFSKAKIKNITPAFPSDKIVEIESCINEILHEEYVYLTQLKKAK
jgi:hypothetical protein